jgi:hypothetical protein
MPVHNSELYYRSISLTISLLWISTSGDIKKQRWTTYWTDSPITIPSTAHSSSNPERTICTPQCTLFRQRTMNLSGTYRPIYQAFDHFVDCAVPPFQALVQSPWFLFLLVQALRGRPLWG